MKNQPKYNFEFKVNLISFCIAVMAFVPITLSSQTVTRSCASSCSNLTAVEDCGSGIRKFSFRQGTWNPGAVNIWVNGTQVKSLGYSAADNCKYQGWGTPDPVRTNHNGNGSTRIWYVKVTTGSNRVDFTSSDFTCIASVPPTVTTDAASTITCGTAAGGGNVTADGGATVTARGICWNTGGTPTTGDSKTTDGSGTGTFSSSMTGLSTNTTYYVRAYATNEAGTAYGNEVSFTTTNVTTAGSIGSAQTICHNTAPALLTNSGSAGGGTGAPTYQWQDSNDDAAWSAISGATSATYQPPTLTATKYYRRQATDTDCGTANSSSVLITVDPATVGGSVSSSATVCTGTNGATLTLSGYTGTIQRWEKSTNNWSSDSDIADTDANTDYLNLTTTTKYRAVVQSGVCSEATSSDVTITVDDASVGGSISGTATECYGDNGATLTLSGHTGSIVRWESSTDNWSSDSDITNTTTTEAYSNLTATTKYRAVIQNGVCASTTSSDVTITVYNAIDGGVIEW